MPVHDWTVVDDGIFHAFHTLWIGELNAALNTGLLPSGYYALPERHTGYGVADVLTLHANPEEPPTLPPLPPEAEIGGTAVAEAHRAFAADKESNKYRSSVAAPWRSATLAATA